MLIDLNHHSGFVYGRPTGPAGSDVTARINAHVDGVLVDRNRRQVPRDYLGGSRIGEDCARKLVFEMAHTPKDPGRDFDGRILRIFAAGHQFEEMSIGWLRAAGFDLRDRGADGEQFGFSTAGGRLRGHADGVIVAGPDVGITWPALFEHKFLGAKSWSDLVKHGLRKSKPVYFAQVHLYMAYFNLEVALLTALNRDTLALHHEVVPFDPAAAQHFSDRAVQIIRAVAAGELPPRIAAMARQGSPIAFGQYDAHVWKMRKMDVTPEQALRGGQVICGLNATRLQLNNGMRHAAGFSGSLLPSGPGEKIICLKNQNDLGLINGMFITLDDVVDENSLYFSAAVTDEDGNRVGPAQQDGSRGRLRIYKGHFEDHRAFDKHRHDRDWKSKRMLTEATFGWAITGHKSQGSQWENVVVWDDGLERTEEDRRRWLYTVITRAEQGLVILA